MEQLLKITSVTIQYELKIDQGKFQMQSGETQLQISRDNKGLHIKSAPVKVKIDTFDARNSVVPTTKTATAQNASKGKQAALAATAQFAQEGKMMLRTKIGQGNETLNQIIAQETAQPTGEFQLGFIPTTGAKFNVEGPELSIEYQMDKLNFDWKVSEGTIDFTPGDVSIQIDQMPEVKIEYVGEPLYVPPKAAAAYGLGANHVNTTA